MAEFVEHALERLLPVFEQLKSTELFTSSEINDLIRRCRRYEYRVTKQNKSPDDFMCYTDYLVEVIRLIDKRRDGLKYYFKYDKIDKPLKAKCAFLFRICSDRFKKFEHFEKEISFLRSANLLGNCSRAYTRLLQFYGHIPEYYAEAGRFEFFENKSAENARTTLQMGLRKFPTKLILWATLFEIELGYVKFILERRELFINSKEDFDRKKNESCRNQSGLVDVNDDVIKLGLAKIVFDEALNGIPDGKKLDLLKRFLSISQTYSAITSNLTEIISNKINEYDSEGDQDLLEVTGNGNNEENEDNDSLFLIDTEGGGGVEEESLIEMDLSKTTPCKSKKNSNILDGISADDPDVKKLLEKAVLQPDYDQRSVFDVIPKSKRQLKKLRKNNRGQTAGDAWFSMPATELTDERRRDLELIQMRDAIDPKTHYRKPERDVLPKYFQVGHVIEDKVDFYASRLTKKQRKRTLVEELIADHELLARNKKRYDEIMAQKAMTRRGAFQRRGIPSKHSKRRNRNQTRTDT